MWHNGSSYWILAWAKGHAQSDACFVLALEDAVRCLERSGLALHVFASDGRRASEDQSEAPANKGIIVDSLKND